MQFHLQSVLRCIQMLTIALALNASAAESGVVDHAFSFNTRYDDQDAEVLDYRYGASKLPVHAPEQAVRDGKPLLSTNVNGAMLRGDFLYVKWRNKGTGQVYEDNVDLRQRLPANIVDHRIHFIIKGSKLYVYLISMKERRTSDVTPTGPEMYDHLKNIRIYP